VARKEIPFVSGWRDPDLTGMLYEFCINMQPTAFDGSTKTYAMIPSPGNERFYQIQGTLNDDVIRGMIVMSGHIYCFAGEKLVELTPTISSNLLTTFTETVYSVTSSSGASFAATTPVRMGYSNKDSSGNPELCIVLQSSTGSWELLSFTKTATTKLAHIDGGAIDSVTSRDMVGATDIQFLDNRFIIPKGEKSSVDQSVFDVTTDSGTPTRLRNVTAGWVSGSIERNDKAKGLALNNGNFFIFGEHLVQTWTDAGLAGLPFRPIMGQTFDYGTPSQFTIQTSTGPTGDDITIFLSRDKEGSLSVIQLGRGGAIPISTRQIEGYFANNVTNAFNAIGMMYREDSDLFYMITFPTDDLTFVFDFEHKEWHKREWTDNGRHIANAIVNYDQTAAGESDLYEQITFIGDFESKRIYKFSSAIYTYADNGTTVYPENSTLDGKVLDITETRQNTGVTPPASDTAVGDDFKALAIAKTVVSPIFEDPNDKVITISRLELQTVQGTGRLDYNKNTYTEDRDPLIKVLVSDDRGRSYGNPSNDGIGEAGYYKTRTRYFGLGSSHDGFVFKVQSWSKQPIIILRTIVDYMLGEE
tara:strand:- start:468 stop:2225 length:1758 start_codon:yes stop_codon:yes gene_type:complete